MEVSPIEQASTGFKNALRWGSLLAFARLTVYQNGSPTSYVVPLSDATITVDRNAAQRRSGSITLEVAPATPPPAFLPTSPSSLLAPFGNEVFLEYGIQGPVMSAIEWIPLGLFAIASATIEDSTIDMTLTLDVYDRSWVISQRALLTPYNVPAAGGNFVAEVEALLNQVWNNAANPLRFNITPTGYTVPSGAYNEGEDPWTIVQDMATSAGYEVFFDVNGVVVGQPIPDPHTQPVVWAFTENDVTAVGTYSHGVGGTPFTTPVATTVKFTRDRIFNDVIVSATGPQNATGSASGSTAPQRAEAADTNPNSPTYIGGGMGDVPEFIYDSLITTTAQAQAEAQNELAASLAKAWTIQVSTAPNPLFDIDDVVQIFRARLGLNGAKIVIDQVQHVVRYDAVTQISGRVFA